MSEEKKEFTQDDVDDMDVVKHTGFTQDDLGKIVTITTETGTYYEERIVQVFCDVCAASFIGTMREAGGFLAGHDCYHKWEHGRGAAAAQGFTP